MMMGFTRFSEIKVVTRSLGNHDLFSIECNDAIKEGFRFFGEPRIIGNDGDARIIQFLVKFPEENSLDLLQQQRERLGMMPGEF